MEICWINTIRPTTTEKGNTFVTNKNKQTKQRKKISFQSKKEKKQKNTTQKGLPFFNDK